MRKTGYIEEKSKAGFPMLREGKLGSSRKRKIRSQALAAAFLAGVMSFTLSTAAMAEETGPGDGMTEAAASLRPEAGGPGVMGGQGGEDGSSQTQERPISPNAFKRINGQYVNRYGDAVPGVVCRGISVSKYQGDINWKQVAADDISFAIARVGYLDSPDPYFDSYMRGAAEAGIKTGVYLYSQADTVEKAEAEARYAVRMAKDYKVSYPIAMDVESASLKTLSRQQITDNVNAFCKVVQDSGFYPIVYSYHNWLETYMDTSQIPYDIWYARYGTAHEYKNRTIWQCTDAGKVKGIAGNVCIEMAFQDYSQVIPSEGWKTIDGKWYYFKDYQKYTGWLDLDGKRYYLNPSEGGVMAAGQTLTIDGAAYVFGSDGAVQ